MKTQPSKQVTKITLPVPQGSPAQTKPSTGIPVPNKPPMFDDLHAMVRAYELYVERGRREGCAE